MEDLFQKLILHSLDHIKVELRENCCYTEWLSQTYLSFLKHSDLSEKKECRINSDSLYPFHKSYLRDAATLAELLSLLNKLKVTDPELAQLVSAFLLNSNAKRVKRFLR